MIFWPYRINNASATPIPQAEPIELYLSGNTLVPRIYKTRVQYLTDSLFKLINETAALRSIVKWDELREQETFIEKMHNSNIELIKLHLAAIEARLKELDQLKPNTVK